MSQIPADQRVNAITELANAARTFAEAGETLAKVGIRPDIIKDASTEAAALAVEVIKELKGDARSS